MALVNVRRIFRTSAPMHSHKTPAKCKDDRDAGNLEVLGYLVLWVSSLLKQKIQNQHRGVKNHRYLCRVLESWQWKGGPGAWKRSLWRLLLAGREKALSKILMWGAEGYWTSHGLVQKLKCYFDSTRRHYLCLLKERIHLTRVGKGIWALRSPDSRYQNLICFCVSLWFTLWVGPHLQLQETALDVEGSE